jgi:hypothetical protein
MQGASDYDSTNAVQSKGLPLTAFSGMEIATKNNEEGAHIEIPRRGKRGD